MPVRRALGIMTTEARPCTTKLELQTGQLREERSYSSRTTPATRLSRQGSTDASMRWGTTVLELTLNTSGMLVCAALTSIASTIYGPLAIKNNNSQAGGTTIK